MNDAVDPALVTIRTLTYGLAIWLFGAVTFPVFVGGASRGRWLRVGALGLALAATSYVALLAREIGGSLAPDVAGQLIANTGFGRALATTAGAALLLTAVRETWGGLRLALAAAALAALAFVGHAADGTGWLGAARLGLMGLHLLAVGAWIGALPALAGALRRTETPAALLRRFGLLGAWAVGAVLVTGLCSLALVAADARWAPGPAYVRTLLIKLAFVAGLLALAAINRFWLTPKAATRPAAALPALRRSILLEQAMGLGAIVTVALLGQLDPAM